MPKLNTSFDKAWKRFKKTANTLKTNNVFRGLLAFFAPITLSLVFYGLLFWGRIYPNTYVAGIDVSGKKPYEAEELLKNSFSPLEALQVTDGEQTFSIETKNLEVNYDFQKSSWAAYNLNRAGNIIYDLTNRIRSLFKKQEIGFRLSFDEKSLDENLSVIAGQIGIEAIEPSLTLKEQFIFADAGKRGVQLNKEKLKADIGKALSLLDSSNIVIEKKEIDPSLNEAELKEFEERGENIVDKKLTITFEDTNFTFQNQTILDFLSGKGGYKKEKIDSAIEEIAKEVERKAQNPVFTFDGGRVEEFAPAKDGIAVKKDALKEKFEGNLRTLESSDQESIVVELPVEKTPPDIQTEEVNDLGINELIGRGDSTFRGSISSRIHNIGVASSRFNGVLIKPGEVFSFNNTLGDVSEYTGYKQAYVIKDGKTVLGDGGGVCQVSTTLFRAALDAGLPIIERRAHSYRVGYYEQGSPPGLDATVYSPTTDLKFKNDTPGHLLIQTIYVPSQAYLAFEIYGTNDGRVASTTKPVITDVSEPPEDEYVDDPTLPAGQIKQIEYKAWGAKVRFTYTVKDEGEITFQKTFYSNYQPWKAVYLRGTGPAQ